MARRYKDVNTSARWASTGPTAPTVEGYRDTSFKLVCFDHATDDEIQLDYENEHDDDLTIVPSLHAHILPLAAGDGDVRLAGWWVWCSSGVAVPAIATWNVIGVTKAVVAADVYEKLDVQLVASLTRPASPSIDDILFVRLFRSGNTGVLDTYETGKDHGTARCNLAILRVGIHYQNTARPGSIAAGY